MLAGGHCLFPLVFILSVTNCGHSLSGSCREVCWKMSQLLFLRHAWRCLTSGVSIQPSMANDCVFANDGPEEHAKEENVSCRMHYVILFLFQPCNILVIIP